MISRPFFTICLALMLLSGAADCSHAQTSDVGMQGRWIFTTQVDGATEARRDMATTAAIEDDNVWLLLTCSADRQTTLSFVDVEGFSYPVESRVDLSLGIDTHPTLTLSALKVNDGQISLDPASSRDLLPLLLAGNGSSPAIPDSRGENHRYSFALQPNDLALSDIRAQCFD